MSKKELIVRELVQVPEQEADTDSELPAVVAESSLSKDWLTTEEDAAWASLSGTWLSSNSLSPF
jgi:hypothetical protein